MDPNVQVIIIVGSVIGVFLWLRQDIRRVEDKLDNANMQNLEIRRDIRVLTEKVARIEGFFETPALKFSSDRARD